jgi:hypothetical protein
MNKDKPDDGVPQSSNWGNPHSLYWNWIAHRFYPLLFGAFYSVRMDRTHSIRFTHSEKKQIESGYGSPSTSIRFVVSRWWKAIFADTNKAVETTTVIPELLSSYPRILTS